MDHKSPDEIRAAEAQHGLGASWGREESRAAVLVTNPDGSGGLHPFANGIRNCVGLAIRPGSDELWCATNERDALGDNLPPDYVTRVANGGFYGWPWYYTGGNEDPRHKGERPDLADKVMVPDVLLQPHSAPLELTFYEGSLFPASYRGNAFVALHGSWNRGIRTGYKVARIVLKDGKPTGEYEDFLTGMVASDQGVWARPVGVAVAHDGALLVSEDANGTIWRVSYAGAGGSR
jgi:glucose/arabinose dehydrogenase